MTLIGEVLQTASFGLPQFIVGRVILGFGVGILSATAPVWQSECSPPKNRGKHVVLDGLFISFGCLSAAWVYSTVIFQENLGLPSQTSRILSGGTLTWKFLSCFVAFFTVDRFGRRALLMVSGAGMALCMLSLCIATSFGTENKSAGIAAVFFIYMFNFFIPIGFLGANFLYCTEVAPIKLRVAMASISTANHWLWNLVVTLITPVAIADIGYRYYILYTVIGLCIPVTFYFFYPETMGRSLEELDEAFRSNSSILGIVSASKKLLSQESLVEDDEEKGFSVATLEEVDKKVGL
ncbi:hypothetical protein ONS96_014059 [Cadophora gregata f. sp. sojae]|nr:hypothetical protein ONS96_014059 [Cadophora gregata f. sp. sojae]